MINTNTNNLTPEEMLKTALQQIAMGAVSTLPSISQPNNSNNKKSCRQKLIFTHKELMQMSEPRKKCFTNNDEVIYYRKKPNGVYEIRYQRRGMKIFVSSKDIPTMKKKFIKALDEYENYVIKSSSPTGRVRKEKKAEENAKLPPKIPVLFNDYAENWLINVKKPTQKESTFKCDFAVYKKHIYPRFKGLYLSDIDRDFLQKYINESVSEGKMKTATVLHRLLRCIFEIAADDYEFKSPMKYVVVPKYQKKKGNALTPEQERKLVDFCIANKENATSSALLVLLYFGLRKSELKTLRLPKQGWLECDTSKQKMGLDVLARAIPFTPMLKKVLPYIDFEKAKNTNTNSLQSQIKRVLPNNHIHELRYTFITRCKECGVNPEVVMRWDGHSQEEGVKASRVELGYTDYSEKYMLKEAEKVVYEF